MIKPKKRRRHHSIQKYRHLLLEPLEDRRLLTSGLELLKDIHPNPQKEEGMLRPIQVGDLLYFLRSSEIYGWELWKSDGTPEGSSLVKDIFPGQAEVDPNIRTMASRFLDRGNVAF